MEITARTLKLPTDPVSWKLSGGKPVVSPIGARTLALRGAYHPELGRTRRASSSCAVVAGTAGLGGTPQRERSAAGSHRSRHTAAE